MDANAEKLSRSLDKLEKSSAKATGTLDRMGKVGMLLAAGHATSNLLKGSGYASDEDLAGLNMTMRGMALGGMLKGKKGALVGGGMGLMETMLLNLFRDEDLFGETKEKLKNIPLVGEQIGEALDTLRDVTLTLVGDKKREEEEEQARIDAQIEHQKSAKTYYDEALKSWKSEQILGGLEKASAAKLGEYIGQEDKLKKHLADLFDPNSEERKKYIGYGEHQMIALAQQIMKTKKELAEASTLSNAARKEQESRYERYWAQPFGPMTNFSRMGISFGETNPQDNRIVHNQELGLEYVRQIRDKIARGEIDTSTWQ